MKAIYCGLRTKLLTLLIWVTTSEGLIKVEKLQLTLLPLWTPDRVVHGMSSQLPCLSLCGKDELTCNVAQYDQVLLECKIGWLDSISGGLSGNYGFFKVSSFMVDIIVRVVNSADNSPLVGVNIGIQRVGGEQYPSQVTNSVGEAIFHILRFGSLSITAEEPGFTTETTNRILNTSPVQEVILALSAQLLPGQLRSVLTWTCCVEDMDIFTISTLDTSCWVDFDVTTCHRGSSGSISFKIDSGDYGSKGGETLEWSGNFPSPDPYTIWVQNYNWEDEISTAGAVVSMFSSNEQSIKVVAPSDVLTNTSFWLVGCFDPNLGLASFQEINLYTNALDDHVLCSIS